MEKLLDVVGRSRRKTEEEGEVLSVMAALHNFSKREQKESQGKWKAKEGVLVEEARRGTVFFSSYTKLAKT